jgi:hypothetical protein
MKSNLIGEDRRRKPRMEEPLPLSVRGAEPCGKRYQFETVARNIGAGGLCAFAPRVMQKGEKVSLRIRFARLGSKPLQAPEVSMRGMVKRVAESPGGFSLL